MHQRRWARTVRRPMLLALVYGMFLVVVGVTATAQAMLVGTHFTTAVLKSVADQDVTTARAFVEGVLTERDLVPGSINASRVQVLETRLRNLVDLRQVVRMELRTIDGAVLLSTHPGLQGVRAEPSGAFLAVAQGHLPGTVNFLRLPDQDSELAGSDSVDLTNLLRVYVPINREGRTEAVFGVWRDGTAVHAALENVRRDVIGVTLVAASIVALLLYLVFRAAQERITRQTEELVEATQRDALTDLLNHGAVVAALEERVARTRDEAGTISVALVDIDNFSLLNDTYGHAAGDLVLTEVASILTANAGPEMVVGRYGPDEFLIAISPGTVADAAALAERLRDALAALDLTFEDSERLPTTVSAGLCEYPHHGTSVTELLTTAALALAEAKTSGGDHVVVANAGGTGHDRAGAFDVLQGLVFAIDTKDRYTKRHSEDVARYGLFLADRLGLDAELRRSIHLAGLLHDVGKIGIPDDILRKPGRLTGAEYEVVKQHVALGDLIVRDVGDAEIVRAGVRHHHERWDGGGYLTGLSGNDIPLIARILAVGDAFSAMTTSRPYRKAFDVREAIRRLEDAAGTQLDEELVRAFVLGMENAEDAPLPGRPDTPARLWLRDPWAA